MAWKFSTAGRQMQTTGGHGIRVTLQLAGQKDREERGLAGRLVASTGAKNSIEAPHIIEALIHIGIAGGSPRLGESICPDRVPLEILQRLQTALDDAWRTAKYVDLLDEEGHPLLLGALDAHALGVSRWLTYYFQDGR